MVFSGTRTKFLRTYTTAGEDEQSTSGGITLEALLTLYHIFSPCRITNLPFQFSDVYKRFYPPCVNAISVGMVKPPDVPVRVGWLIVEVAVQGPDLEVIVAVAAAKGKGDVKSGP